MKIFLLGLVLCFSGICHGQLKDCFAYDGTAAGTNFPCDPDAEVSACCGMGHICASSLFCVLPGGSDYTGTCTDRSFGDNACPFPLTGGSRRFIWSKNATLCQDGTICPNAGNEACCNSGSGKKEIIFHYADPIPSAVKDLSSFYALAGFSVPSSTTSSSTTSSAAVSTTPTSTESSLNGLSTLSAPVSRTGSLSSKQSTSSESPTPNSASSGLSSSAKAGIGVGISLGIALIAFLAVIFLRRYRKRVLPMDPMVLPPQSHSPVAAEELHGISVPAEMNGSGRTPLELNGKSTRAELRINNRERYEV